METITATLESFLGAWFGPILFVVFALVLYLGAAALFRWAVAWFRRQEHFAVLPFELLVWPFRLAVMVVGTSVFVVYAPVPEGLVALLEHLFLVLSALVLGWFMVRTSAVLEQFVLAHYRSRSTKSEVAARKVATHLHLARKLFNVLVVLFVAAAVLMTFDTVRQVGLSILASAGIASIILGLAAQKSLGTLIAGIQIAVSQPISIGDVVIVEGEWGRIEEITLTYVVVLIWDQRRLIVPITWFIERPFQNWTRTSSELLGTVYVYVDYAIPIESLRHELERIVGDSPLWDGRLAKMQVTKTTEKTVELRALVSARDSSELWELRCLVRERLIDYIRVNFPGGLPKVRMEVEGGGIAPLEG